MLTYQGGLEIDNFFKIIFKNETFKIDEALITKIEESFNFLMDFSQDKVIYGVNTGFGPMAQYKIEDSQRIQLQYNLIRSHASGVGQPLPPMYVRAIMLARLNTLSLCKSGIHKSTVLLMQELINRDITPVIFEHGSVGASGDLVQLAHLALVLIGEGEVFYKGERKNTDEVFKIEKLQPISVELREGLALMNEPRL